ncbi:hypothetical protein D9615_000930 [Tricholomella constricta]|uniref:F-box domain-containing protein n=1 Tax=Tricholomella constricta TaxID=117010 RepID=A0A8H5M952_9AGAR|nr:hypothetical protein D9615_000930 [Tricholomella constricta]
MPISSDHVLAPCPPEHLSLLPLSDTNQEDFFIITGYNDTKHEHVIYPEFTWNVMAYAIMKTERRKLTGKKKQFDLKIFLGLPLDLILEIFGHLHPIDIYHIVQTSKSLRNIVLARNSASLWKTCFSRHPEVPSCPPDISAPQWATLLFGPEICDYCGTYSALPDFTFRQHLCDACLGRLCISKVAALYEPDDIVWRLVPATHKYVGYHHWGMLKYHGLQHGEYMRKDLQVMTQKLKELREDIAKNKSGSKAVFEAFTESTEEQHAATCNEWAVEIYNSVENEYEDLISSLRARITERLIGLGHDPDDISSIDLIKNLDFYGPRKTLRLTRRFWRENKPSFEALIASRKEKRQRFERETLLYTRRRAIQSTYFEYQKTLSPMTWETFPDYTALLHFEDICSLLNDPSDAELNELVCSEVFAKLPEYLHKWHQLQLQRCFALLPDTKATGLTDPTISMHKLYLATSVFTCIYSDCKGKNGAAEICLFGWDDVSVHAGCPEFEMNAPNHLAFSTSGSVIAGALVSFLGLDPTTASVSDMDRLNARLLCAECPQKPHKGGKGRQIYTWREYVKHANDTILDALHLTQSWHLLSPDTTALVRLRERKPVDHSWTCNHCAAHVDDFVSRSDARKHVRKVHSISAPRDGDDIINYRGADIRRYIKKPDILVESPLAEFRCARCPDMGKRLYSTRQLEQHLRRKHKVSTLEIGRDFVKVQLIQRSSTTIDSSAARHGTTIS